MRTMGRAFPEPGFDVKAPALRESTVEALAVEPWCWTTAACVEVTTQPARVTDPGATNYDDTIDDGTCEFPLASAI